MTDTTTLGQRIAEGRKKLGLSQEAFGDRLGVSRQAASKWESDAAVPEIDKLITMSKIFGVSIGWLLGVEDQGIPTDATLSESQLAAVTELLCRYPSPCPERKGRKSLIAAGAAGLAIAFSLGIAGLFLPQSKPTPASNDTELLSQIDSLIEQNVDLQTQIDELTYQQTEKEKFQSQIIAAQSQEIEELRQLIENSQPTGGNTSSDATSPPPETLQPAIGALDSWVISPKVNAKTDTVTLQFIGFTLQEAASAQFAATIKGHELYSQPCQTVAGGYSAELEVPALNGYTYYFMFLNKDGILVQIPLTGHNLSDLSTAMEPTFRFSTKENAPAANGTRSFWLSSPTVELKTPSIIDANCQPQWKDLKIVYRCDGEIVDELALADHLEPQSMQSRELSFVLPTLVFDFQKTAEGSAHSLRLEGSVTAGDQEFSFDLPIGYWVMRQGKLDASSP